MDETYDDSPCLVNKSNQSGKLFFHAFLHQEWRQGEVGFRDQQVQKLDKFFSKKVECTGILQYDEVK